jgi:hypothetical protein
MRGATRRSRFNPQMLPSCGIGCSATRRAAGEWHAEALSAELDLAVQRVSSWPRQVQQQQTSDNAYVLEEVDFSFHSLHCGHRPKIMTK